MFMSVNILELSPPLIHYVNQCCNPSANERLLCSIIKVQFINYETKKEDYFREIPAMSIRPNYMFYKLLITALI